MLLDVSTMDLTTTATATASIKTPEPESETPTRIQSTRPLSSTNGVLKRHHPLHHHHHHHNSPPVVTYKECLKNHAAGLGGHAVDGCGEFMPSPTANPTDPTSLKCAACGCHRNFHRRDPEEHLLPPNTTSVIEYQPHHRHHPLPPPPSRGGGHSSSPSSPSPPPISSSYYPSAPHMLLALSTGLSAPPPGNIPSIPNTAAVTPSANGRKRFRTKFTQDQKERMLEFAERLGWKMQKRDEESITEFCNEVGVDKGVLKVWMHNNKNTFGRRDDHDANKTATTTTITNSNGFDGRNSLDVGTATHYNNDNNSSENLSHHLHNNDIASDRDVATTNGSSSS